MVAISFSRRTACAEPPARIAQLAVTDTIAFAGGLPDPRVHPASALADLTNQVLRANDQSVMGYGGYEAGDMELRLAVAERMSRDGVTASPEHIVLTNGSSGALTLAAQALLNPGDVAVVEHLSYRPAANLMRQMGARVVTTPVGDGGLVPDALEGVLTDLARAGTPAKLLYTIATCHSPTGATLDLARRKQIADLAERFNLVIVQDNTYGDIRFTDDTPPPFLALAPDRTIHAGSFSKTIAPGLRTGWAAASPAIADMLKRVRTDLGTSAVMQRVIARFIQSGAFAPHLARVNHHYREKRDLLDRALARLCAPYVSWHVPDGGFFIWLRLHQGDVRALAPHAEAERIFFLPGPYFSPDEPDTSGIRLAFGEIPAEQIEPGVERLVRVLKHAE